jgi:iron complex transport system permease protein
MRDHKSAIIVGLVVLFVLAILSLAVGRYQADLSVLVKVIVSTLSGRDVPAELTTPALVLWTVRLPRLVTAMVIGAALSLAGTVFQSLFRNPLVSPSILGVTSGASFGATLAMFFVSSTAVAIEGSAFLWGLIAVGLAYQIGKRSGNSATSLVLAGVIISALFTAGVSYLKYRADPYQHLPAMVFWSMGSFNSVVWTEAFKVLAIVFPGSVLIFLSRWWLNPLALGDEDAMALGVNVTRARLIYIISGTLIVAASVAASGSIGWVGLIVPHMARLMVGSDHDGLIPFSAILGAIFMLVMDTLSRILPGGEIPVGVLTALLGAPFFAYLLISNERKGRWQN